MLWAGWQALNRFIDDHLVKHYRLPQHSAAWGGLLAAYSQTQMLPCALDRHSIFSQHLNCVI